MVLDTPSVKGRPAVAAPVIEPKSCKKILTAVFEISALLLGTAGSLAGPGRS
jgi:hypothetical protein